MPAIELPRNCGATELFRTLCDAGALGEASGGLSVRVPNGADIHESAAAFLCAWGLLQKRRGRAIHVGGDISRLVELGLLDHLGIPYTKERRSGVEGMLPLKLVSSDKDVADTVRAISLLLAGQFASSEQYLPAVEWVVSELVDNVFLHADSEVPGVVSARYHKAKSRFEIAVVDVGRGIRASLGVKIPLWSDGSAIDQALRRGVTRDEGVGQGNGLAGAREIVRMNGGFLEIWSGTAVWRAEGSRDLGFKVGDAVPGTGVMIALDTRGPIDLKGTWIAGYRHSRFLGAQAPPPVGETVVHVLEEVESTGTRGAGRKLRELLLLALGQQDAVSVDFEGVTAASSSFLDELLGRLALELGPDEFRRRVRVEGLASALKNQAEAVLEQRLEGLHGNRDE